MGQQALRFILAMVAGMLSLMVLAAFAAPIETVLGDGTGPTVLALHGLGDTPASFARVFDGMPGPARLRVLEGPLPWRGGRAWLSETHSLAQAADRIAAGLTEAVAVVGFSQGGALALALAVRHPQRILAAVSIAGGLPEAMLPEAPVGRAPPVTAFHGGADTQAPLRPMRRVIRVLDRLGYDAELRVYPKVGHSIPPEMRGDLSWLLSQLETAR